MGGGATARVGQIIGPDRMTEMMLTGRKYSADDGLALGLAHYSVGEGEAIALAQTLAGKISLNAPFANMLMLQAIPRINDMGRDDVYLPKPWPRRFANNARCPRGLARIFWKNVRQNFDKPCTERFHDQNQ